jgi:peptidoglycan-N-acetylglucosamine deacetylase
VSWLTGVRGRLFYLVELWNGPLAWNARIWDLLSPPARFWNRALVAALPAIRDLLRFPAELWNRTPRAWVAGARLRGLGRAANRCLSRGADHARHLDPPGRRRRLLLAGIVALCAVLGAASPGASAVNSASTSPRHAPNRHVTPPAARPAPPPGPQPEVGLLLDDAQHVPLTGPVRLRFTRPMNPEVGYWAFRLTPAAQGSVEWEDAQTLVFRPEGLLPGTSYRVDVLGSSLDGILLKDAPQLSFTTLVPPQVAVPFTLTFDDCGSPAQVGAILDALHDRGLHAIFFPTGACRDANPWLVPTLVARGHRVCNHTYSHPYLTRLSDAAVRREISLGVSEGGCDLLRPPYGDVNPRVAQIAASLGYRIQLWDVDTRDWAGTPATDMIQMIRARGGVVVMHMHGAHTAEAIRGL